MEISLNRQDRWHEKEEEINVEDSKFHDN